MKFLFTLILICCPLIALADVEYAGGLGLNINENNNNADINSSIREEASFSWYAGSRILYSLKDTWSLRTGLGFQDKSALYSYKNANGNGDLRLSVISMTLPLEIQWKIHNHFSPFAGYQVDFGLNDNCHSNGNANDCSVYGDMKSVVHHAVIGGSIHFNPRWDLDFSYQRALTDSFTDVKIHTLAFQLFYKF